MQAAEILRELGTPLFIHQPSYSLLNRWVEGGLLGAFDKLGVGCIAFSPLAQGMLTDKYLNGVPADSRMAANSSLSKDLLTDQNLAHIRALNEIAKRRGQSLAQMAVAWVARDNRVSSVLIGASSVRQLEQNLPHSSTQTSPLTSSRARRLARRRGRYRSLARTRHELTDQPDRIGVKARFAGTTMR